jgi:(S)-ureidoglycine aminohydrolase
MTEALTIRHDDELERQWEVWVLVRKSLGVSSFGVNLVELPAGGGIPEHDETGRDQEEIFYVVAGSPTLVVDGTDHPLRPGSCARLDPELRRTVRNDGAELAKVLIVSAPQTSGYEPMGWA